MRPFALLVLTLLLTACGAGAHADKSGGEAAPVTLHMATIEGDAAPYADGVREFARQAALLSDGSVRVEVEWEAALDHLGEFTPGADQKVAGLVQDGTLDMALIPARTWDRLGVSSLQALQAPFLVNTEAMVDEVVASDLADDMLAGLDKAGVVGIALLPEGLRYPVGFDGPLLTPGDFAGVTMRMPPSDASFRLAEALGSEPVDVSPNDLTVAVEHGDIAAAESEFARGGELPRPGTFTGNMSFFAKESAIVANERVFEQLSRDQRKVLREAAGRAQRWMIEHDPTEAERAKVYCGIGGRIVSATAGELAAVRRAAEPVYATLARDPQTSRFIERLRETKQRLAATQAPPATCGPAPPPASARSTPKRFPEGVYRRNPSARYLIAHGMDAITAHEIAGLTTLTIADGRWSARTVGIPGDCHGTYRVDHGRLALRIGAAQCGSPADAPVMSASWSFANGELRFLDVREGRPLEWGGMPWRRIS